ncbi:MAG: SDR family NAD(P)-dependent oxidoreductase, partial [Gemmatales bacterium]|nr:SDR family oxidoreductase [Gemmatales bacterium]MDW7996036.1 SDR family NAD(P)-dependent oxidoreductase [Gemmatales bacterium]
VVTGGAQGIGEAISLRLAAAGARVAVFDRNVASARRVAEDITGLAVIGDVTNEADIAQAVETVTSTWGPISILVNNAGITGRAGRTWELDRADWEQVLTVNVIGPVLFAKAVVPHMLQQRYGRIVNIASIAGKEGNPTLGPYSASKAALIAWTKSLAKELVQQGDITVNAVSPAVIATPILSGLPQSTIDY